MIELDRRILLLRERLLRASNIAGTLSSLNNGETIDGRDIRYIRDQIDMASEEHAKIEAWARAVGKIR